MNAVQATPDQLVEDVYLRALCRRPTAEEVTAAREITGTPPTANGAADLLWTVLMLPEFHLVR